MPKRIERQIPIDWFVSQEIKTRYANNVIIQHSNNEFVLSFFEVLPPLLIGSHEEVQAQLAQMRSAHAECVARIVMNPQQVKNLARALQENLQKYLEQFPEKE